MKRVLLVALSVALFASVANAQGTGTVWLTTPGGGDNINLFISETAVIQVWMNYTSSDPDARLLGVLAQLEHRLINGQDFEVTGFIPSPDLPVGLPGSQLSMTGRGILDPTGDGTPDVAGVGNLSSYQFQGDVPAIPVAPGGWDATMGLDGSEGAVLLDSIIIHGVNDTLSTRNRVIFDSSAFPRYTEGTLYGDGHILSSQGDVQSIPFAMGTGANKVQALFVHVTVPEPGSLALLAFGGLAAIRRRR